MEYKGLFRDHTTNPWASFDASPAEVECAKLGYLAGGDEEALDHLPTGNSMRDPDTLLDLPQARRIVAGNIRLLGQLNQSEQATQSPEFATVTEYVISGAAALQQGAKEEACPPFIPEASLNTRNAARASGQVR